METTPARKAHPLILAAAASVLLFSVAGTAALMGWLPDSLGDQSDPPAAQTSKSTRFAQTAPARLRGDVGVIESVRVINVKGQGTGAGAVVGGVGGAVVGRQFGSGRGKDAMTVVGAVGGGLAGHEVEKNLRATKHYEVTVRFDDGTSRVYQRSNPPAFKTGDRVRVTNGDIQYI